MKANSRYIFILAGILLLAALIASSCGPTKQATPSAAPQTSPALSPKPTATVPPTTTPAVTPTVKPTTPAPGAIEWKVAVYTALGNSLTDCVQYWADLIKERTNGRLIAKVYPGQALVTQLQSWDAVRTGLVDAALTGYQLKAGDIPLAADALNFPYSKNFDTFYKVWYESGVTDLFAPDIRKKLNAELLLHVITSSQDYYFKKPALTVADMKGAGPGERVARTTR